MKHHMVDHEHKVVCEATIEDEIELKGQDIANHVKSFMNLNPKWPRPVYLKVETPIGYSEGWIRIVVTFRHSSPILNSPMLNRKVTRMLLVSPSEYETGCVREKLYSEMADMYRQLEEQIKHDGPYPKQNLGPIGTTSLADLTCDFSNSIKFAYNSIFGRTCWGKAQSFHPADAVKVVYTSGPVTTLIFKNGVKFQVRKSDNDLLNKEKGLAMVVCKAVLDKETYEVLCKYAGKGAVITLAKFLMSPPEYAKLKAEKWKVFE